MYSPYCAGRSRAGQHKQGSKQSPIGKGCVGREGDAVISYRFLFAFEQKLPVDCLKADIAEACSLRPEK